MGDGSVKRGDQSSYGRRRRGLGRVAIGGLFFAITTVTASIDAAPSKPEAPAQSHPGVAPATKKAASRPAVPMPDAPNARRATKPPSDAQHGARAEEKSTPAPRGDAASAPVRRRGGSVSGAARSDHATMGKPGVASEVEGGTVSRRAPVETSHASRREAQAAIAKPATKAAPCVRDAVFFERGFGGDAESVALTRCDGRPMSAAVEQLSILVRPMNVARPGALASRIRRAAHREWLPGVKRIHGGLVTRLQTVVDRFRAHKVTLVSGYRPASLGSFHQSARALDLHVEGVSNEQLVEFCRTLADTGCGYYPNSSFVHIDVRPAGTGHVYWIDASGPGEPARYVSTWPPKDSTAQASGIAPPDPAAPLDEQTHPGATIRPPFGGSDAKIDARTTAPWWGGDNPEGVFSP